MFKKYGVLGIILIIFAQLNFIFKIQPFALWYIPIIWWGYILTIDAIVFKIKRYSLISNNFKKFISIVLLSIPLWGIFEVYNFWISESNWIYVNFNLLVHIFDFMIIFPAIFETADLLKAIHGFEFTKLNKKHIKIDKKIVLFMIIAGIILLLLPFCFPSRWTTMLLWIGFFLLLDPINYLHNSPSFLGILKNKADARPMMYFAFGALICGLFWEFWNYWAYPKWFYILPDAINFFKVFEMPVIGYIGYLFFGLEVFVMYYFIVETLHKEEKEIVKKIKDKSA